MSKERYNKIVDEVFKKYGDSHWTLPENPNGPLLSGKLWSLKPMQHLKETFINECKTDKEFSKRWGLQIEERELSLKERLNLVSTIIGEEKIRTHEDNLARVDKLNIPTKVITVTYKDEIIEILKGGNK
jgi:hypothetical protein